MRGVSGLKKTQATGQRRSMHSEYLHDLYSTSNAIGRTKSRTMEWARLVAGTGQRKTTYRILAGEPDGKNLSEDLGVEGNLIIKWNKKGENLLRWAC